MRAISTCAWATPSRVNQALAQEPFGTSHDMFGSLTFRPLPAAAQV